MKTKKTTERKKRYPLRAALIVIGAALFAYGLGVISIIGTGHWFQLTPLLIGAFLVLLGLLVPFLSCHALLKWAVVALAVFVLANVGVFEARIIREAGTEPAADADWVIVLGAKVNGRAPSLTLYNRSKAAAAYLSQNRRTLAVTTGGRGADEGMEESLCAKEVIVSSGVDPARVMTEEKSTSTQENLLFAREIIEAAGGSRDDSVVIVTSGFHVYRTKKLAASVGFSNVSAKASKDLPYLVPYYYFREYAANLFESVAGHFDETEAE